MDLPYAARLVKKHELEADFEALFASGDDATMVALMLTRAAQIRMVDYIDTCEKHLLKSGFHYAIADIIRFEQAPMGEREKALLAWVEVMLEPRASARKATIQHAETFFSVSQLEAFNAILQKAVRLNDEICSVMCPPDEMRDW